MKKIYLSGGSYIIAGLLILCGFYMTQPYPENVSLINPWFSGASVILVVYGILSAFTGIKTSKSTPLIYSLIIVGFVILYFLLPVIANFLLAFTPV